MEMAVTFKGSANSNRNIWKVEFTSLFSSFLRNGKSLTVLKVDPNKNEEERKDQFKRGKAQIS